MAASVDFRVARFEISRGKSVFPLQQRRILRQGIYSWRARCQFWSRSHDCIFSYLCLLMQCFINFHRFCRPILPDSIRQPLPTTPTRRTSGGAHEVNGATSGAINVLTPPRSHAGSISLPTGLTPPTKENGAVASGLGVEENVLPISSSRNIFLSPKLHSSSTSLRREEAAAPLNSCVKKY